MFSHIFIYIYIIFTTYLFIVVLHFVWLKKYNPKQRYDISYELYKF